MFERFTDRSRRVLVLAQEEARRMGTISIGSEHLLLAFLVEGDNVASTALQHNGVTLDATRTLVRQLTDSSVAAPSGSIPFTNEVRQCLESALRISLQLGHHYIAPEHLLLGTIQRYSNDEEIPFLGMQVLNELGVELAPLRQAVIDELSSVPGQLPEEFIRLRLSREAGLVAKHWLDEQVTPIGQAHPLWPLKQQLDRTLG